MAAQADSVVEQQDPALQHLVAGYRPLPGVFDEMMDAEGRVRLHWHPFLSMLAALGGEEINRRFAAADRSFIGSTRMHPAWSGHGRSVTSRC